MNQNIKEKRRFNFVDAIIIIILLALAALVAFIFFFKGAQFFTKFVNGGETSKVYYAVEVPLVDERIANNFDISAMQGNKLTDSVKHTAIGEIAYVTVNEAEYIGGDSDGAPVAGYYPGYKSVTIIIRNESTDFEIPVGKSVYMSSAHFTGEGHCLYFKQVDEFSASELESFMQALSARQFSIKDDGGNK